MKALQEYIKQLELPYETYKREVTDKMRTGIFEAKTAKTTYLRHKSIDPAAAFKFLVIYDFGNHTLLAAQHLIKNLSADMKDKVIIHEDNSPLTMDSGISYSSNKKCEFGVLHDSSRTVQATLR